MISSCLHGTNKDDLLSSTITVVYWVDEDRCSVFGIVIFGIGIVSGVTFCPLSCMPLIVRPHCPFRGCAGDWVQLGVAKRHGAVLGDAICLNSSLPDRCLVFWKMSNG